MEPKESVQEKHHQTLAVRVRYIGSHKAFEDPHASVDETLGALRSRALSFFGLTEEANKVYTVALDGVPLTDLTKTLGQIASGKHELKLDLLEQFEQG